MKRKVRSILLFTLIVIMCCGCGSKDKKAQEAIVGKWVYDTTLTEWNFVFNSDGTCSWWSSVQEPQESTYEISDGNIKIASSDNWDLYYVMEGDSFYVCESRESGNDWVFSKDNTYDPTATTLLLTKDMIDDIKDMIDDSGFAQDVLFIYGFAYQDLEFTDIEFKKHEKTNLYVYTAYGTLYAEDNYGQKYRQNFDMEFTAVEDAEESSGYSIDWDLQFVD